MLPSPTSIRMRAPILTSMPGIDAAGLGTISAAAPVPGTVTVLLVQRGEDLLDRSLGPCSVPSAAAA
ncbi:hypothetical protein ACFWPP_28940 [Streptomyces anulatus]|uniref:hypothetical protein n=1 Tax=Streptomyces TaxID=1883 RepID=UPI00165F9E77|nr:hypothetical protein HYC88_04470 [Streptomyces sp. CB00271]